MLLLTLAIALCVACSFTEASSDPGCTITSDLKYQKLSSYGEGFVKNVTKWFGPKFNGGDLGMDYSIQVPFTYKETTYQFGAKIFGIVSIEANMSVYVESWSAGVVPGEYSIGPSYARRFAYYLMNCDEVIKSIERLQSLCFE
ncbi:hypothetical protein OSTOST_10553 [Ostertagia ostertagi]